MADYAMIYHGRLKDYNLNNYINAYNTGYYEAVGPEVSSRNNFPFNDESIIRNFNSAFQIPDELLAILTHIDRQTKVRSSRDTRTYSDPNSDENFKLANAPIEYQYLTNGFPVDSNYFPVKGIFEVQSDGVLTIQYFHRLPDGSVWTRSYNKEIEDESKRWTSWACEVPSIVKMNEQYSSYNNFYEDPNNLRQRPVQEENNSADGMNVEKKVTGYVPLENMDFRADKVTEYNNGATTVLYNDIINGIATRQFYLLPINYRQGGRLMGPNIYNFFNKFNGTFTDMEVLQMTNKVVIDFLKSKDNRQDTVNVQGINIKMPKILTEEEFSNKMNQLGTEYVTRKNGRIKEGINPIVRGNINTDNSIETDGIYRLIFSETDNDYRYNKEEYFKKYNKDDNINVVNNYPILGKSEFKMPSDFPFKEKYKNAVFMTAFGSRDNKNVGKTITNPSGIPEKGYSLFFGMTTGGGINNLGKKIYQMDKGIFKGLVCTNEELFDGTPEPTTRAVLSVGNRNKKYYQYTGPIHADLDFSQNKFKYLFPNSKKVYDCIGKPEIEIMKKDKIGYMINAILLKVYISVYDFYVMQIGSNDNRRFSMEYIHIPVDEYFTDRLYPFELYNDLSYSKYDDYGNPQYAQNYPKGISITYRKANEADFLNEGMTSSNKAFEDMDVIEARFVGDYNTFITFRIEVIQEQ